MRLSRRFHEVLGSELATELEESLSHVEHVSRAATRELLEARFEQRLGETRTGIEVRLEPSVAGVRADIAALEARLTWRMFLFGVGTVGRWLLERA